MRSVLLARVLGHVERGGHEVVAVGLQQPSALSALATWAERIYAVDLPTYRALEGLLASSYRAKLSLQYDIGPDDWKHPDHPDLLRLVRILVDAQPVVAQQGRRDRAVRLLEPEVRQVPPD